MATDPRHDASAPARRGPLPPQEPLTGGDVPSLYKLSDAQLQERAEAGNEEAERVLQDRVIVRGLVLRDPTYTDQHWTWLDAQLCLHFKRSAVPPYRVRLIIKINESMTGEFFELHWSEVRAWEKFLCNLQGPEPSPTESALRQGHCSLRITDDPPWLKLDRDKNDERPYVCIFVNDTLGVPEIKRHWSWVRSYQQFLREDYGPHPHSSDGYLSRLNALHEKGMSYAKIARRVEQDACYMLARHLYHLRDSIDDELVSADQMKHWLEEGSAALDGMKVLKCSEEAISYWLRCILRSMMEKGRAGLMQAAYSDSSQLSVGDFLLNQEEIPYVVDRQKVIDALKKIKDRGKKGLGVRINRRRSS